VVAATAAVVEAAAAPIGIVDEAVVVVAQGRRRLSRYHPQHRGLKPKSLTVLQL
jgi:hypothetical protein